MSSQIFSLFFLNWNPVDGHYYVSSRCNTQWFDFCICVKWSPYKSNKSICPHTKSLGYHWPYSSCCRLHPWLIYFYSWRFVPLYPFSPSCCQRHTPPLWQPPIFFSCLSLFLFYVCFWEFTYKWDHTVFLFLWLISFSRMPSRFIHVVT